MNFERKFREKESGECSLRYKLFLVWMQIKSHFSLEYLDFYS